MHLSFDGYKEHKLQDCKEAFRIYRMVPPGNLEYYYTIKGSDKAHIAALTDDVSPTRQQDEEVTLEN